MKTDRISLAVDSLTLFMEGFAAYLAKIREGGEWRPETLTELAKMAEAFNVLVRSMGRAAPELTALAVAGDVIRELADLVQSEHPALVADLEPILQKLVA